MNELRLRLATFFLIVIPFPLVLFPLKSPYVAFLPVFLELMKN